MPYACHCLYAPCAKGLAQASPALRGFRPSCKHMPKMSNVSFATYFGFLPLHRQYCKNAKLVFSSASISFFKWFTIEQWKVGITIGMKVFTTNIVCGTTINVFCIHTKINDAYYFSSICLYDQVYSRRLKKKSSH